MKKIALSKREIELIRVVIESEKDNVESDLDIGVKSKEIKKYDLDLSALLKKIDMTLGYEG